MLKVWLQFANSIYSLDNPGLVRSPSLISPSRQASIRVVLHLRWMSRCRMVHRSFPYEGVCSISQSSFAIFNMDASKYSPCISILFLDSILWQAPVRLYPRYLGRGFTSGRLSQWATMARKNSRNNRCLIRYSDMNFVDFRFVIQWGAKFFLFFNATGLLKNWRKTAIFVPFFLSFFLFFSFFFFFFLFSFFFFLGGDSRFVIIETISCSIADLYSCNARILSQVRYRKTCN